MGLTSFLRETFRGPGVETRAEWGTEHIIPAPWSAWMSDSGVSITEADAYGIPAVSNVIRSPAELIAALPFFVYTNGDVRTAARDSWQWSLLHDQPSELCDSFRFFYDLVISLEATQNAFVRKVKGVGSRRERLEELHVIDPHRVVVRLTKQGEKVFDIWTDGRNVVEGLTSKDILHVRGFTPNPGGIAGVSLIELHRNALGAQRAQQKFEGDYFQTGGAPPFWFEGASNPMHAKEIVESYKTFRSRGSSKDPYALWGNITAKSLPISMSDAAYVENKQLSVEDACRIWRWPKEWVESKDEGQSVDSPTRTAELIKLYVYPRLRRIERAFQADADLFGGSGLYGEFLSAALERADFQTRVRGYKDARQGGWITANEIRQLENLPPREEGDELQVTPVGGAPNQPAPKPAEDEERSLERVLEEEAAREARDARMGNFRMPMPSITVQVPEQPTPEVNITLPELNPTITVQVPEQPTPQVNVDVQVPEQKSPVVHLSPVIDLEQDDGQMVIEFERNPNGTIKSAKVRDA